MNLLDLFILIPLVWLCIRGFSKGLIIELATLIGMMLGILAAYYLSGYARDFIREYFTIGENTLKIISYTLIFLAVYLVVYIIGKVIEKSVDLLAMGWLNKLLGGIFGLAKGVVVVCIILFIFEKADPGQKVIRPNVKENSFFYGIFMDGIKYFGNPFGIKY
jgi:membrane protein required for colicin V production